MGVEEDHVSLGRHQASSSVTGRPPCPGMALDPGAGAQGKSCLLAILPGQSRDLPGSQVHPSQRSPGRAAFPVLGACSLG